MLPNAAVEARRMLLFLFHQQGELPNEAPDFPAAGRVDDEEHEARDTFVGRSDSERATPCRQRLSRRYQALAPALAAHRQL